MSVLVKNGTIVTAESEYIADIFIEDGKFTTIGQSLDRPADTIIDATGKYILPGGVDQHVHFENMNSDGISKSAGYEGTYIGLLGGTTTIVDFCAQEEGMGLIDSAYYRLENRVKGKLATDISLHVVCTEVSEKIFPEILELPKHGISTLKLYMAYKPTPLYVDDATMFRAMRMAKEAGVTLYVHAENGDMLNVLRDEAILQGRTEPKYHFATRPSYIEHEATQRAINIAAASGCPLCVVHVSCEEAARAILDARTAGQAVVGETLTSYMLLDESLIDNPDFDVAARYTCSPPFRKQKDREFLWKAVKNDWISVVGSDHVPICLDQKRWGKNDFREIINGIPGIGERLPMLWTYGVETGRISRSRLVNLYATSPARLCGIYPRKGAIRIGSDADLVVYDPNYRCKVSLDTHPTGVEYNPFEGMDQIGRAETVLLRGDVVVKDGVYIGTPGKGKFIPADAYGMAYDLL